MKRPVSRSSDATDVPTLLAQLGDVPDLAVVLDGGTSPGGRPSTVVDCSVEPPRVLRQGAIPAAAVAAVLRDADLEPPLAP